MSRYTDAQTQYVREKIKQASWKERDYIIGLLIIEETIAKGGPSPVESWGFWPMVKNHYPEEYQAILTEMRPEEAARRLEREVTALRRGFQALAEAEEEIRRAEEEERRSWFEAGGQP